MYLKFPSAVCPVCVGSSYISLSGSTWLHAAFAGAVGIDLLGQLDGCSAAEPRYVVLVDVCCAPGGVHDVLNAPAFCL